MAIVVSMFHSVKVTMGAEGTVVSTV